MPESSQLPGIELATVFARDRHNISRQHISANALKVLYRLASAGYAGFLVGGSVRDLLLGKVPKDFDIATDGSPEQLRRLFRNSRIIGRRFKIVHIRFGREVIEVTTFRAHHTASNPVDDDLPRRQIRGLDSAHSSGGMILRDNVYGSIDQDARRRDFTVNALYYTIDGFKLLDFSTGLADLAARQIRIIGDPATRYREDPVRMLRAMRFAAKLDFTIEQSTAAPIAQLGELLLSVSAARLFDETLKLFSTGHAVKTFALLQQHRLGRYLIPPVLQALSEGPARAARLLHLALENTDRRIAEDKTVMPYFLFAALLWPRLCQRQQQADDRDGPPWSDLPGLAGEVIAEQTDYTAIPRRISCASREIWELQWPLQQRIRHNVRTTYQHPRFRAAYDFLLLREQAGEDLDNSGQWWTDFQFSDTNQQQQQIAALPSPGRRRRYRRRRQRCG